MSNTCKCGHEVMHHWKDKTLDWCDHCDCLHYEELAA